MLIAPAIGGGNRYFIFRNNGLEVEFSIENGKPISQKPLTEEELNFIYKHIR